MSSLKLNGFEELSNKLSSMEKSAENLEGTKQYSFDTLFNKDFMLLHTQRKFQSFDDFFKGGNFGELSFKEVPDKDWEQWVKAATDFPSWKEMQQTAIQNHIAKELGF